MKIQLKQNWDEVTTWENRSKDEFFIETPQSKKLFEYIFRKKAGSILISGQKGAGKTTSTVAAVNQIEKIIKKTAANEIVLPVYISSLYFEAIHDGRDPLLNIFSVIEVLKQLIKRLQYALRDIKKTNKEIKYNKEKLEGLLRDLSFTELVYKEKTSYSKRNSYENGISTNVNSSFGFGYNDGLINGKSGLVSKLRSEYKELEEATEGNEKFASKIGLTVEDLANDIKNLIYTIESQQHTTNWFKRTLYNVFNKNKKDVEKLKVKLIFIFDELDFFDDDPKQRIFVLEALKKIKSLLTSSDAHFIFIVGEKVYEEAIDPNGKYWTLFTERIFFHRLEGIYLNNYLDKIIKKDENFDLRDWELGKWSLIAKSKHNFFELIQLIKSSAFFDEDDKYTLNIDITDIESETLASLHYALNTIYEYFLQNPRNSSLYNLIYEVLDRIESSFLSWLHGNGDKAVSFAIPHGAKNEKEIAIIRNAVHSLLIYLYRLSGLSIQQELLDGRPQNILPLFQPNWQAIRPELNIENVKKGITGPISPEERGLFETTDKALTKINNIFESNFSLNELSKAFTMQVLQMTELSKNDIKELETIINIIDSETYFSPKRQQILIEKGNNLLTIIQRQINKLTKFKNLLLKKEWGDIDIDNEELILKSRNKVSQFQLDTRLTILPKVKNEPFTLDFEYLLSPGSMLDILFVTSNTNGSEINDEFFFARYDSRKTSQTVRDGILFKASGTPGWGYVKNVLVFRNKQSNRWLKGRIEYDGNSIKLLSPQKDNNHYQTQEKYNIDKIIKFLGFANQEGEVKIRSIKLAYT